MMTDLHDDYSGSFDPNLGLADFARGALARLGREYLLHGHLQDRVGIPLVLAKHTQQDMLDVAIEEWMAASPIYSLRTQRALNFGNHDVPTIFKNIQLDIGVDNMCWEQDYPHSDSSWPKAPEEFARVAAQFDVSDADVNKITHENAMRWYRFDPFAHRPREQCTVRALRAEVPGHDVEIRAMDKGRFAGTGTMSLGELADRATA